ncbi:MAG: dynamin family protein [Chloroflexota bacterium]
MARGFNLPGLPFRRGQGVSILSEQQHQLVAEELALLERLQRVLDDFPATIEDRDACRQAAEDLTALFMLVVVGEFNSGKSTFINALVGAPVMPMGVTPTTAVINLLMDGPTQTETVRPDGLIIRTYPAEFLKEITIVDTPGTNAVVREHEALTQRFVPRSDMVLFVTSADRPFSESEREFMAVIREWGKKIIVVINKIDQLRDDESRQQVIEFVSGGIQTLLGFAPEVFPVSSWQAYQAKIGGESNPVEQAREYEASNFGPLERYIFATLDEEGRIRLKLLNPLGVGELLTDRYQRETQERLELLRDDIATIDNIDRQLVVYQEDMRKQFEFHLSRIETIIARMMARGDAFFEETIRIGRVKDLLKSEKIRADFERQVIADTEQQIDAAIQELIDWMVEQDLRTWKAVTDYIDRRRLTKYEEALIGEVGGQFRYDRRALLETVSRRAQEEVDRYDARQAAEDLSLSVRNAVAQVAMLEAGALGLGALVVAAASTLAFDFTGILLASFVAGLGLFVLPNKRRKAREEFRQRAGELETNLVEVMRDQFEKELARSVDHIRDAIAPYTRFVRTQYDKLNATDAELGRIRTELGSIRHKVGDVPGMGRPSVTVGPAASPVQRAPLELPRVAPIDGAAASLAGDAGPALPPGRSPGE